MVCATKKAAISNKTLALACRLLRPLPVLPEQTAAYTNDQVSKRRRFALAAVAHPRPRETAPPARRASPVHAYGRPSPPWLVRHGSVAAARRRTFRGTRPSRPTPRERLECNCSPATAAAQLDVVKNTVVYRIRRAEQMQGRSVKEQQGILWAALHLVDVVDPVESQYSA
ncbi:helix-turn-helix domain-containing protein [Streptomyces sp. NPDC001980]|uniref:helix-turn-helix domain-containing protein n=1 Tax=Streptomyces sp. NPDC001980 TaxID=3157126 RepID=UPI003318993E